MADLGAIGLSGDDQLNLSPPTDREFLGSLSITGTAQVDESPAGTLIVVHALRSHKRLMEIWSRGDGSFAVYNLAAGTYVLTVYGNGDFLPGNFAVAVS